MKFIVAILISLPWMVWGYSGAGAECGDPQLQIAAISGKPGELQIEIDRAIDFRRKLSKEQRKTGSVFSIVRKEQEHPGVSVSRDQMRNEFVNSWTGCSGQLLDFVAAAGNLENAKLLLKLGATPNRRGWKGDTIFMRCLGLTSDRKDTSVFYSGKRSKEDTNGVLAVYSLLISVGGDLNAVDKDGNTALHSCKDPEAIRFFLSRGANPNVGTVQGEAPSSERTPLSHHVSKVVTQDGLYKNSSLLIVEILARAAADRRVGSKTESAICYFCSGVELGKECAALSAVLSVTDKRIFRSKGYVSNENSRFWRCQALLDPDCTHFLCKGEGDWRKHYDMRDENK